MISSSCSAVPTACEITSVILSLGYLQCSVCHDSVYDYFDMVEHLCYSPVDGENHFDTTFPCDACGLHFNNRQGLLEHVFDPVHAHEFARQFSNTMKCCSGLQYPYGETIHDLAALFAHIQAALKSSRLDGWSSLAEQQARTCRCNETFDALPNYICHLFSTQRTLKPPTITTIKVRPDPNDPATARQIDYRHPVWHRILAKQGMWPLAPEFRRCFDGWYPESSTQPSATLDDASTTSTSSLDSSPNSIAAIPRTPTLTRAEPDNSPEIVNLSPKVEDNQMTDTCELLSPIPPC
ncbi:uncharacterized protein BROUX77_006374 [Berkeleyomyces rouxiae]|uniref:uncharacterized protein n=1 Tax=Berkeleyomyces rouxiae TaxID=2035830 RepID=UPI003B7F927D